MAISKIDNITIVVENLDEAVAHFRRIFDFPERDDIWCRNYKDTDRDSGESDEMHFFMGRVGDVYLELIEPVKEDGAMMKFLRRTGGGLQHIGITSDDIRGDWKRHNDLREEIGVVGDLPRVDHYGVSYWYLHPRKNYRVLFEVDQEYRKTSLNDMTPIEPTPDWAGDPSKNVPTPVGV